MAIPERIKNRIETLDIPRHVAIIMDGNGRWAERHGVSHLEGHYEGRKATRRIVQAASDIGIEVLSVYAFSTENWSRSDNEVSGLMQLIEQAILQELSHLKLKNVRVVASGRLDQLPEALQEAIEEAMEVTAENASMTLNLCVNYGGRAEIADAARAIASDVASGDLDVDEVDIDTFAQYLYRPELPDPDLLVRSSGELRLSNFLLWQSAYCEFVSMDVLWPDFDIDDLVDAVEEFNRRNRRFGGRPSQEQ